MDRPPRKGKSSIIAPKGPAKPPAGRPRGSSRVVNREEVEEQESEGQGEERASGRRPAEAPPAEVSYRLSGMSLAVKVALATVLAVVIASATLTVAAFKGAAKEVDEEINEAGIRMVKVLAAIDVSAWKEIVERTSIKPINDTLAAIRQKLTKVKDVELPKEAKDKLDKALTELQEEANKATEVVKTLVSLPNPFQRLGNKDLAEKTQVAVPAVLDLVLFDASKQGFQAISSHGGGGQISLSGTHTIQREGDGKPEITEGRYSLGSRSSLARSFRYPIRSNEGNVSGEVLLILSAERIEQVQSRLSNAFVIPFVIALAVGAGIGFFMASTIVRPVKILLRDIHAVSQGDLDHKTHAHSGDEIGLLARAFNAMTGSLKAAHKAELETKALEHELNIATEIQSNLLPKRIPRFPGFDIGAFYRPSKEVGGDYYDFVQIDQENLGIVVADVSGKGIPGSMVMTMARSLLRMEAERNLSTADTLVKTNRILARDIRRGMFVTAMYMILNVRNRTLLVSSAGHNPLIIVRASTKNFELVNPNGIALGFDKGPIFERTIKEQRVQLFPGDRICSYTDGVVESMSPANEEFGDDKFYDMNKTLAPKTSNEFITSVVDALDKHQSNGPQHDDITLVTVRLLPA